MINIAIVIPCYKRVDTLKILINSLLTANYSGDEVTLIFSIDYSGIDAVAHFANSFNWPFGEKRVICHPENIGLRNNILFCGDLTDEFDAVIVIEDDLEVANSFYQFAKQAAEFYAGDDRIGGISIYNYYLDEMSWNPFLPINEGFDVSFVRWASSWGQLWTRKQWTYFRDWLNTHEDISSINVPARVKLWKRSWKKYYISYLADTDRYFVFPTQSYILNANKPGGEHTSLTTRVLTSSPFNFYEQSVFRFQPLSDAKYRYDSFFQLIIDPIIIEGKEYDAELDLFGNKDKFEKEYVITSRPCPDKAVIHSFDNALIPYELNILTSRTGSFFNLVHIDNIPSKKSRPALLSLIPDSSWQDDLHIGLSKLINRLKSKF